MAVKVITDSTSDLPSGIISDLNISIVPIYVRFGENIYRQGIDISNDEFYARIDASPVHPATSQPPPEDFIRVYNKSHSSRARPYDLSAVNSADLNERPLLK